MTKYSGALFILFLLVGCQNNSETKSDFLFELKSSDETGISFENKLTYSEEVNPYTFKNFYNGGGVAIGDLNNDGLPEILFAGNLVSNKLYRNNGNLNFTDITESSGLSIESSWSTGVSFVDINGDGLLDIYICKSGPPSGEYRHNTLYINQGDFRFTEESKKYGLDNLGLSTHASFFDYDKDGDLDCYLLNNSIKSVGGYDFIKDQRLKPDTLGGNKLMENQDGFFVDVSQQAGIYSSAIGFGLGVTISDVNADNWPDVYVSNDFFERDYLYINNQDGTFTESLEDYLTEISMGSMGADIADINNDGHQEIFVTEMLPDRHDRLMSKASFEQWDKYQLAVENGYYHQFGRNVLQLNNGNGSYSDISRLTGTDATDWSWGALIFDMDNNGYKDIFVANGIYKDLLDQDYINFMANPAEISRMLKQKGEAIKELIDMIPSEPLSNYAFSNQGELELVNKADEWGLGQKGFSNGSAYGDLDNDGDLDLVLNNANMPAFIYENRSDSKGNNYLSVKLTGSEKNTFAIGSVVKVYIGGQTMIQELSPMRGFQSSIDYDIHFGLGTNTKIDSLEITWPNGQKTFKENLQSNQQLVFDISKATSGTNSIGPDSDNTIFTESNIKGLDFKHVENNHIDFDRDRLIFQMSSNEGPCACTGDLNNDGLTDLFIGGAKDQAGVVYMQRGNGSFQASLTFTEDKDSEDLDCQFGDLNGDGKLDLVVASGGSEFSSLSSKLKDRVYFGVGNGNFEKENSFPSKIESTSSIALLDVDSDGDLDIFTGGRLVPGAYGIPASSRIFINTNGNFSDVTDNSFPDLINLGMVTDAKATDIDLDGDADLVLVGKWMPVTVFVNENGKLVNKTVQYGFDRSNGLYNTFEIADVNNDSLPDIITGNHGLNSRFNASSEYPMTMWVGDLDQNGKIEQIPGTYENGILYPILQLSDLTKQLPSLKKKFLRYESYKNVPLSELVSDTPKSLQLEVYSLESEVWINSESQKFEATPLPLKAQFSPVYSIHTQDFNDDGNTDIATVGNLSKSKPEYGIYAGSYGAILSGNGSGKFESLPSVESGFSMRGEGRDIIELLVNGRRKLVIVRNNDAVSVYDIAKKN